MNRETPTKKERTIIIIVALSFILPFLHLALKNNSIANAELCTITVTLTDTPKYTVRTRKGATYREIVLTTREYDNEFRITGMTYDATDLKSFKATVFSGDTVDLKIKTEDIDELRSKTFEKRYHELFNLTKKGVNYVDLNLRTKLKNKDAKAAFAFVLLGLVMLSYGFIKGKVKIDMTYAVIVTCIVGLIAVLILRKY